MPTPVSVIPPSGLIRGLFAAASVLAGLALVTKAPEWTRRGSVDWAMVLSLTGILMITITGALNVTRGRLRIVLTVVGAGIILAGAILSFTA